MNLIRINKKEIIIVLIVLFFWVFVQFIYGSDHTRLADQQLYISDPERNFGLLSNTFITLNIYRFFRIFLPGKLSTIVPILFTSIFLFRTIKPFYFYLPKDRKLILFSIFSMPHFWIWQSAASKEALMIPTGLVLAFYFSKYLYQEITLKEKIFILISFILIFLIKPQFSLAYLFIGLSLFIKKKFSLVKEISKFIKLSFNYYYFLWILSFTFLSILIINFFKNVFIKNLEAIMFITQLHLLQNRNANTSRYDFNWQTYRDFFDNMIWGIPTSFLGFKPNEILGNYLYSLIFIEGLISILVIFTIQIILIKVCIKKTNIRFVYFLGILPAILIIMTIQYSVGIFNAGTAIRYKQSLMPILIYFPLYLIEFQKLRNYLKI